MKYYGELSNIETQIIRLSAMSSVLRVISIGAEQANTEDVRNALWYIEGSIEDIHDCLNARFNELWETVRDEDIQPEEKHKGGMKKKKMMTDRELP
jgi:predicted transcriptional regulator